MERITKPGYKFDLLNALQGLTKYTEVDEILNRLAAYEDTGLTPEEIETLQEWHDFRDSEDCISADRLRALAEADRDGRCVVLPCKVGDTVWVNFSVAGSYLREKDKPYACTVLFVCLNQSESGGFINFEYQKSGYQYQLDSDQIGKTVFLTRAEAEAALGKAVLTGKEGAE